MTYLSVGRRIAASVCCVATLFAAATTAHGAITSFPGLVAVRIWEFSGGPQMFQYTPLAPQLLNQLPVLNATNKTGRAGAEFSYTPNQGVLLPGSETEPVTWPLRVNIPHKFFKGDPATRTDPSTSWFTSRLTGLMLEVTGFGDRDSTR